MSGGQGTSWRAGDVVLKPAQASLTELSWWAAVSAGVRDAEFRLARQLLAADGSAIVSGWCATEFLVGEHGVRRWPEAVMVGERLHAALRDVQRPGFLDSREDPWSIGDRVAWDELPASRFADAPHILRLATARRRVTAPSHLIHGDLGGNVLYHDVLAPAVIDFVPYWRPAGFAAAIIVADALVWEGADARILASVRHIDDFGQYLIRALIYRMVTELLHGRKLIDGAGRDLHGHAVDVACVLAA
jgi:uncharacterized protein (TIGR02569 family)